MHARSLALQLAGIDAIDCILNLAGTWPYSFTCNTRSCALPNRPTNSVRPDEVMKGGCYYLPHPQKVWVTVMVLETPADTHSCRVRLLDDGTELSIDLHECTLTPMQAHGRQGESNLAKLDAEAMHEPELLTILDSRCKIEAQQPYTAVGDCLLVVNPLRVLQIDPAMKDVAVVQLQHARALPPHPFVLAEEEYMKLKVPSLWPPTPAAATSADSSSSDSSTGAGRCVVVAGASGAGISHTAAHIVRYLGWRGTAGVDAHCTPAALTSSPPSPRGDSPAGGASTSAAGAAAAAAAGAAGGFGLGSEHRRISALPPQRKSSVTAAAPAAAAAAALAAAAPVSVCACLAAVDTVLQAFLGAATPANHSSSRYGRVTKLHFEDVDSASSSSSSSRNTSSSSGGRHKLCAASVQVFLPELSRLCAVSEGHRNFNVLYSLLAGADKELRRRITVLPLDYYGYLNQTSVGALDEVSAFHIQTAV
jgi:Myosin head (motor domain)